MNPDDLQNEIDALLRQSDDARRLGVVSVRVGKGAEDIDLASCVPVEVTVGDHASREFIIYSRAVIDRFLETRVVPFHGLSIPDGVFFSTTPMVIVKNITAGSVLSGVLSYLEVEGASQGRNPVLPATS